MSGLRMRPRVGQPSRYVPPPSIPPYEPPAPPIFEWTIASILKWNGKGNWSSGWRDSRTSTVFAATETEAIAKLEAALAPVPAEDYRARYRREITVKAVNEVQP